MPFRPPFATTGEQFVENTIVVQLNDFYQLKSLTYRICFISLPIPVTGPEGPSKFLVLSWELAFYEISVASQKS